MLYFNGNNAMNYLIQQCEIGPRYPGSQGHLDAINFYHDYFNKYSKCEGSKFWFKYKKQIFK